ncbi:acylphosphatase [Candidatus Protochlamydia phocaeensis]|uniref:acylphosphatase n=1 Tax=Candidatus Protochlamydia phocaeensis TaxID=1414722 RepID=UPI0008395878|nr:acylphosphatase [Candidatus Protochlamydia phocaeensis]
MEHSSQEIYEMRAIVKGNVQGVGFRALTRYHALGLGLKGTVRNLSDGTVEIYAQGSKQTLENLINRLKEEMGSNQIEEATLQYFPIEQPHEDFRILY